MNSLAVLRVFWALACYILAPPLSAQSLGRIDLVIHNLVPGKGQLLIGLCMQQQFLMAKCTVSLRVEVTKNPQVVSLPYVAAGDYAVQVVYDKNKNGKMDTSQFGAPTEPVGFSRDAVGKMGPPRFEDARFRFDGSVLKLALQLY
jgi:uncharacterized protein (DUF2141 family)